MTDTYEISAEGINIKHTLTLTKSAERILAPEKLTAQIEEALAAVNTRERVRRGWQLSPNGGVTREYNYDSAKTGTYRLACTIHATCTPKAPRPSFDAEFQNIINSLQAAITRNKWRIETVDDKPYQAKAPEDMDTAMASNVGYAPIELPAEWGSYFDHLYGLDAHIMRIKSALEASVVSDWRNRFHCALIGPPGCGKSDICQSVKRALGDESVMEFDATSTTMAGAQKELNDREELPRVMLVEEIEKAEQSLSWLLSVADLRAEIRKTTARGNILRDTKMLIIATVNDEPTFEKVAFGALASRFSNKIYFHRPPRALLERIIMREIGRINGDPKWAAPTLDYAEQHDITDPRTLTAIALCGREGLLDGTYQKALAETADSGGWQK